MSMHDHSDHQERTQGGFLTSRSGIALVGFLAIGAFFLVTEHWAHVWGILPFLLLLLCPLLHLFHGHGGHGGHGVGPEKGPPSQDESRNDT